jgi:prevent-host-death family protein
MAKAREQSVKIAQLKAQLSAFVRAARGGHTIVVCERDTPVARLVPYAPADEALTSRLPLRAWGSVPLPTPVNSPIDSLAALLQERQIAR